jgi:AraC family transcriptional regulator
VPGSAALCATPTCAERPLEVFSSSPKSPVEHRCIAVDDLSVHLSTYQFDEPFETVLAPHEEFRLGMLLKPAHGFRASFIGAGFDDLSVAGQPLCIPPGLAVRGTGASGRHQDVTVNFSKTRFTEQTGHSGDFSRAELRACLTVLNKDVANTLSRLSAEVSRPGLASNLMIEALTSSLVVDLYRQIVHANAHETRGYVTLSRRQLALIHERAYQDGPAPSIKDLAELSDLSKRQLIRLFKRTTGKTLHEFVEAVRLERAVEMLAATTLPLKDISFRLGFAAPSSFSIAFRRLTGNSPRSYRRAARLSCRSSPVFVSKPSELLTSSPRMNC